MENIFLRLLKMSIVAGWIIIAIIIIRLFLKNAPAGIRVFLWAFAGLRLILPFSFESMLSLIPSKETIPQDIVYAKTPDHNILWSGVCLIVHILQFKRCNFYTSHIWISARINHHFR